MDLKCSLSLTSELHFDPLSTLPFFVILSHTVYLSTIGTVGNIIVITSCCDLLPSLKCTVQKADKSCSKCKRRTLETVRLWAIPPSTSSLGLSKSSGLPRVGKANLKDSKNLLVSCWMSTVNQTRLVWGRARIAHSAKALLLTLLLGAVVGRKSMTGSVGEAMSAGSGWFSKNLRGLWLVICGGGALAFSGENGSIRFPNKPCVRWNVNKCQPLWTTKVV